VAPHAFPLSDNKDAAFPALPLLPTLHMSFKNQFPGDFP